MAELLVEKVSPQVLRGIREIFACGMSEFWSLESGIQIKYSGIQVLEIQYLESGINGAESRIHYWLGFPRGGC